ncbi:MAG: TIGR03915 family putative DNA repair protein [Verrucomicrobiota bacterium]
MKPVATFSEWRIEARRLLESGAPPESVFWEDGTTGQCELFNETTSPALPEISEAEGGSIFKVPKAFFDLAEVISCHRDARRWGLLYRILWRIARGGERHLLARSSDDDILMARSFSKEIGRDLHKMRAFVRFRKVGVCESSGREQFVAWFEPMHRIIRLNAPFFRKRFTGMDWSILTPDDSVHWDGQKLRFTDGVPKSSAPDADSLEELWKSYYRSIFNPARLKLKAMQAEMPVKYWKNLPEAELIHGLTRDASRREHEMIERRPLKPRSRPKNAYLDQILRESGE